MEKKISKNVVCLIVMIAVVVMSLMSCNAEYVTIDVNTNEDTTHVCLNKAHWQDLHLIILPEAYRAEDMQFFKQDVAKVYTMLQNVKPYSYMLDRITVSYSTACVSQSNELGSGRTALGCGLPDDRILTLNNDSINKAIKHLSSPVGKNVVLVIVNTEEYIGYTNLNSIEKGFTSLVVCSANDYYFITTVIHELGHAIGKLDDEYVEYDIPITSNAAKNLQKRQESGFFLNTSLDEENVYWKCIIDDADYQREGTGVYVGGGLYASGVFRSTENSVMRSHRPDYNVVSRYLIYQQLMKCHTGVSPLYTEFKREDLAFPEIEWDWQSANRPTNPKRKSAPARQAMEHQFHNCIVWE